MHIATELSTIDSRSQGRLYFDGRSVHDRRNYCRGKVESYYLSRYIGARLALGRSIATVITRLYRRRSYHAMLEIV